MNYLRYQKIDLPIYDENSEVAWTTQAIKMHAQSGRLSFLRRAALDLRGVTAPDLTTALLFADNAMADIREQLHVDTVGYSWGLYKGARQADHHFETEAQKLIPPGFHLIADVDVICNSISLDEDDVHAFNEKYEAFHMLRRIDGNATPIMDDIDGSQLLKTSFGLMLFDIDPILCDPVKFAC